MPRIHHGGGWSPFGSAKSAGVTRCITVLRTNSRIAASAKPNSGDSSSALAILVACDQSTPEVPSRPRSRALVMPTPMIDPIRVCELEAGKPKYQVPTFQMIAAIKQREHHGEAGAAADLQDQLDRQQRHDAERDRAASTSGRRTD